MVGATFSWAFLARGSRNLLGSNIAYQLGRMQVVSDRSYSLLTSRIETMQLLNCNFRAPRKPTQCWKPLSTFFHSGISSKHSQGLFKNSSRNITQSALSSSANQQSPDKETLGKEIYYGMFEKTLKGVKIFSLTNSFLILSATPVFCYTCADKLTSHSYISAFALTCSFFVGVVVPVFLHTMSRRYVTNLFFNAHTNTFTLQYYSLFMRKKYITFTSDDVTLPLSAGYSTHLIKNRPYFIMKQYFYSDEMHAKMLGC